MKFVRKRIEQHTIFPYVAWTTIICFALYTGHLTLEMQEAFEHLAQQCLERNVCIEEKR